MRLNFALRLATPSLLLCLIAQSPAQTVTARIGSLLVVDAWSRPTAPVATVGVVYFSVTNVGKTEDSLIGLSSPAAAKLEIHRVYDVHGSMEMREVGSLPCPAGATVKSEPGGLHVMLLGLARPLIAGESFPVSLKFRDAGMVVVQVHVENRQ